MTDTEFGTRFLGKNGQVILFLRHDPVAVIIPEGVEADVAAKEFVRLANEMFLSTSFSDPEVQEFLKWVDFKQSGKPDTEWNGARKLLAAAGFKP